MRGPGELATDEPAGVQSLLVCGSLHMAFVRLRVLAAGGILLVATACHGSGKQPPTAPPPPAVVSTGVLIGAGDIAICGSHGTEGTADLLDLLDGTVFTAGDNAYF